MVAAVVFLDSWSRVSSSSLGSGMRRMPICSARDVAAPVTWVRSAKSVRFPTPSKPTMPAFMEPHESYYNTIRVCATPNEGKILR